MVWIVDQPSTQAELASRFRELMNAPDILQIPGAHDAMAGTCSQTSWVFRSLLIGCSLIQQASGYLI